jgi:DNA-binding transcriptional ArsR family regulator
MERKRKSEEIDKKILEYLASLPLTATTEMVAKAVGVAWYTAEMHLQKLKDQGKVEKYRIGRQNQWILAGRVKK